MLDFFLADFNLPYSISISIVFAIACLEGVGLLIGLSISNFLEDLFSIDFVNDTELPSGGISATLGWLYLHRLPMLVWLLLLLSSFGIVGVTLNYLVLLPLWLTLPITIVATVFITRFLAKHLSKIIPKNESSATSSSSFVGKVATITIGKASKGHPTEAVVKDSYNQKHYVLVEPEESSKIFTQGMQVVLIQKQKSTWLAIEFHG
ncbi:OB-fold-containig protein [Psychromonas algicola]|uniref:OB-fold-containig protein n=1 Tax=Psychromonas algicola TaxID=2555642 RepID=UPI001067B2A1|nr:OB-fold-containig protein [Psychromonas sp. RZ5]TEW47862.1 DUF1449 family protein [Psychromonas sp. RZ5]